MNLIKSKVKYKQHIAPRCELFFCKKCCGFVKETIYDIDTNKLYCSIHQTEEVVALSGIHYLQELQQLCCNSQ